jgi:DNA-binding HxlR family transcriptional regulator
MSRRSYGQFCGVAKALDVVGERWTLLLVRNLLVGGQRYKDLLETLPGITTNLLAERLRALAEAGLIAQRQLPPPAASVLYELTPLGRELEPVVLALGNFGARYLTAKRRGEHTHPRWMMVSLKRRYRGSSQRQALTLELDGGAHTFLLRLGERALDIDAGASAHDAPRVRVASAALRAILFDRRPVQPLIDAGEIAFDRSADGFLELLRAVGANAGAIRSRS